MTTEDSDTGASRQEVNVASKKELEEKQRRESIVSELLDTWSLNNKNFDWQDEAVCKGQGEIFFFERGSNKLRIKQAKELCEGCPVRRECLDFALDNRFEFGIYGGKTPNERLMLLGIHSWNDNGHQRSV